MQYSTRNLEVSLTLNLATYLRANGYDIRWHATDTVETNTAGADPARAEVTLVPEFPAIPVTIVRLKSEESRQDEVVVPALSLQVLDTPERIRIQGLGHTDYQWQRSIRVDGFGADEFQHKDLQDLLHDWLQSEEWKRFEIYDYVSDPDNPALLEDPVIVVGSTIERRELIHEIEAVRYYVRAQATVAYIE